VEHRAPIWCRSDGLCGLAGTGSITGLGGRLAAMLLYSDRFPPPAIIRPESTTAGDDAAAIVRSLPVIQTLRPPWPALLALTWASWCCLAP